jgi:hypothetical protein
VNNVEASDAFFVFIRDALKRTVRTVVPSDLQVGRQSLPAMLQLTGRLALRLREVALRGTDSIVTISNDDTIVAISLEAASSASQVTAILPGSPVNGQLHVIKDASGTATQAPITLQASTGTIDGSQSVAVSVAHGIIAVVWSASSSSWYTLIVSSEASVISGGSGGSGGDPSASYVVLAATGSLPSARTLQGGADVSVVDSGPGGATTIASTNRADSAASYVVMNLTGSLTSERVLTAGTGITIVDEGAGGNVRLCAYASSSLPMNVSVPIVAGMQSIDQPVFQTVAAFEFAPDGSESMAPSGSQRYIAYFQPLVEVFPSGCTLETKLFNATTNSDVANSLLSSSFTNTTRLQSVNLSGSMASGNNMYKMLMRITNRDAGRAICTGAKLFVMWT